MSSRNFSQKTKEQNCFSIPTTFDFKFQVFSSRHDRKKNVFCEKLQLDNFVSRSTDLHSDLKCSITFVNSKMVKFQIFNFFLLLVVVYILYFDNSIQIFCCFHLMTIFEKHEVTPFWWFWQYLLFLCSDFYQIFNFISVGGNLWMKF